MRKDSNLGVDLSTNTEIVRGSSIDSGDHEEGVVVVIHLVERSTGRNIQ